MPSNTSSSVFFYVYVLESIKDGKRYIGHTNNLKNRLEFHNKGLNPSTKNRRPFILLCYKKFKNELEAIRYEKYLKSLKGGKQLYLEIEKMEKPFKNNQLSGSVGTPQNAGHSKE